MPDSNWSVIKDTIGWVGDVIKDGQPVASLPSNMASAVPNVDDWTQVSDATQGKPIEWDLPTYESLVGLKVVTGHVAIHWFNHGRYHGGGSFIPEISVSTDCSVVWPNKYDLSFRATNPMNSGSAEAPIGTITLEFAGTLHHWFWSDTTHWTITVYGTGQVDVS